MRPRRLILSIGIPRPCCRLYSPMDNSSVCYPKINLAVGYEVDAAWPRKPADLPWGQMPGVAVDAEDQVWLHTRSEVPVQAFTADGRFIRAWGQGLFGSAHRVRVDTQGNVWLADNWRHVVRKFTPAGELLLTLGTLDVAGCDETHLNGPTDMTITSGGEIFVSDGYGNFRIVHFDSRGRFIKAWGTVGVEPGQFNLPHTIGVDSAGVCTSAAGTMSAYRCSTTTGVFWTNGAT